MGVLSSQLLECSCLLQEPLPGMCRLSFEMNCPEKSMWYLKHLQECVCNVNKCLLRMHTEVVQGVWRIVHDPNGALRTFFRKSGFLLALGSPPAIWSQSILQVILRLISVFSICWERIRHSLSPFKTKRSNVLRSPQFLISHSILKGARGFLNLTSI